MKMFTYKTKVRISPAVIEEELELLKQEYLKVDPSMELRRTRKAQDSSTQAEAARSVFSQWNNLNHFYKRLMHREAPLIPHLKEYADGSVLIEVVAEAKGNSTRIYFKPSITSLSKHVRKAIRPIQDDTVFVYFDLRAAEFALRAVQAQDQEALDLYQKDGDIYMHYANLFPEGTDRSIIKTILIANMYGTTPYRVAKQLGISETQAQRLLESVARQMPKFEVLKRRIIATGRRLNAYYAPNGFDQSNLLKVADVNPKVGFDPNMAWSAYTQSALGFLFQQVSTKLLSIQGSVDQTFLSIFDSMLVEINLNSLDRFKQFIINNVSPLKPDGFHTGLTMYQAMYGE